MNIIQKMLQKNKNILNQKNIHCKIKHKSFFISSLEKTKYIDILKTFDNLDIIVANKIFNSLNNADKLNFLTISLVSDDGDNKTHEATKRYFIASLLINKEKKT